ncbi:MAG: GGDEF domain-containing protein [Oscillospiraceae bacterium]|nr:GGDEF domain-containing protein [Oscillospiraceae bacterium]
MNILQAKQAAFKEAMSDDSKRIRLQFTCVYQILMIVSVFMTIVNLFTNKRVLMFATLTFALLSLVNICLARCGGALLRLSSALFSVEIILLFTFFLVSGMPEGFSAIWICLLPSSGLLLFQRRRGTLLSAVMLLILLFFLRTPVGNHFLQYPYTASFQLRFPLLYTAFFAVSFFLETLRSLTYDVLHETQQKYEYLYAHDALTNVYNRYGFNVRMDALLREAQNSQIALMILDIDHFKHINDCHGHVNGDLVLERVAALLTAETLGQADVCRWGGEEFAILYRGHLDAEEKARAILQALRDLSLELGGKSVHITASMGVVTAPRGAVIRPAPLVLQADGCLYQAKQAGRNRIACAQYHDAG